MSDYFWNHVTFLVDSNLMVPISALYINCLVKDVSLRYFWFCSKLMDMKLTKTLFLSCKYWVSFQVLYTIYLPVVINLRLNFFSFYTVFTLHASFMSRGNRHHFYSCFWRLRKETISFDFMRSFPCERDTSFPLSSKTSNVGYLKFGNVQ